MKTVCILVLLISCSAAKINKHQKDIVAPYNGEKFDNIEPFADKSLFTLLKWKITGRSHSIPWPDHVHVKQKKPIAKRSKKLIVTVINHATVLIQIDNINILTDPHYSKRASPVSFLGPKRVSVPAINFKDLPPIDIVLISHNHYDHLDLSTLQRLSKKHSPKVLAGLGTAHFLKDNEVRRGIDMDWWQTYTFKGIKINFVPAQHWSARGLFDKREMLWGGFYIEGSKNVYFAGDTGYGLFFKMIKEKYGSPYVALIPIGAYEPRWFMKNSHLNPDDSVKAYLDLKPHQAIGIHFGTFKLTDEGISDPPKDLSRALKKYKISNEKFIVPDFGVPYQY